MHCYKSLSHGSGGQTGTKTAQSVEDLSSSPSLPPMLPHPPTSARELAARAPQPLTTLFPQVSAVLPLASGSWAAAPVASVRLTASQEAPPVDEHQLAEQCCAVRRHDRVELIYPRMRHLLSVTSEPIAWQVRFHRRGASRQRLRAAEGGDDEGSYCSGRTPSTHP